jgi:hypothetical protein
VYREKEKKSKQNAEPLIVSPITLGSPQLGIAPLPSN